MESKAKVLWELLGEILINNNDEIEEPFLHFESGTNRFKIWQWFEEEFDVSVVEDLMYNGKTF